jgi:hypothetical protein
MTGCSKQFVSVFLQNDQPFRVAVNAEHDGICGHIGSGVLAPGSEFCSQLHTTPEMPSAERNARPAAGFGKWRGHQVWIGFDYLP